MLRQSVSRFRYNAKNLGHPPWPRDDEPRSPRRSAAERGNQIGRMSKIQPLPRPALIPGLAPSAAKPPSAAMEAI